MAAESKSASNKKVNEVIAILERYVSEEDKEKLAKLKGK